MSSSWTPPPDDNSGGYAGWTPPGASDWKGAELGLPAEGPGSLARVGPRFVGLFIDGLIFVPLLILGVSLSHPHFVTEVSATGLRTRRMVSSQPSIAVSLALLVPSAAYIVGLIAYRGQTLGQQAMGLKVIRLSDGQVPGLTPSLARWSVLGVVSLIALFVRPAARWTWIWTLVVLLWAAWGADRQGLHDRFARVIVVRTR